MLPNAEDLAHGYWPEILIRAGVDPAFFTGKQGPCPFCGGNDRYIFQNKNGGRYLCRNCTQAKYKNGFDFLMRHMGYTEFRQAADYVRDYFGITPEAANETRVVLRPARVAEQVDRQIDVVAATCKMQKVWDESKAVTLDDPVYRYLKHRVPGLRDIPAEIQYHPELAYWNPPETLNGRPVFVGKFPAMVVRGFDASGTLVQIHKTYLSNDGEKAPVDHPKKTDRGVGSNSFALRMGWPQGDTLGVGEGIETALAATLLRDGVPVWPCHSSTIMANFTVPQELKQQVRRVIIFADSDEIKNGHKAGSEAAAKLAQKLRGEGVRSLIVRPARVGADIADLMAA